MTLSFAFQAKDIRLPGHLVPEKYKVELVPFIIPGNFTIRGKVLLENHLASIVAGVVTFVCAGNSLK